MMVPRRALRCVTPSGAVCAAVAVVGQYRPTAMTCARQTACTACWGSSWPVMVQCAADSARSKQQRRQSSATTPRPCCAAALSIHRQSAGSAPRNGRYMERHSISAGVISHHRAVLRHRRDITMADESRGRDGPLRHCSGRPPHRSQRAQLAHWALASGSDVEALVGPRMLGSRLGNPLLRQSPHPLPIQASVPLTYSPHGSQPVSFHLRWECLQCAAVRRYCVVREVPSHYAPYPLALFVDGLMSSAHQFGLDRIESLSHPLSHRLPS